MSAEYLKGENRRRSAALPIAAAVFLIFSTLPASLSWATELFIPEVKGQAGKPIEVTFTLDQIENLAGVKLRIKYDPTILSYKSSSKTKYTTSLMHIVNDKKPGLLIAVMAGAKGIGGKNIPILSMAFNVKKGLEKTLATRLEITEIQLMSDQLKDIKCKVSLEPIIISPGKVK